MTINELCKQGTEILEGSFNENAGYDSRCLLEHCLSINTTDYMLIREKKADAKTVIDFLSMVRRRATGEPLQYILGEWEFMGNRFFVGPGVLIPRPETELLVEYASSFLEKYKPHVIFDLCSGSGCVAVSVAKLFPASTIFAVEKSEDAFSYLLRNIKINQVPNVKPILGDISDSSISRDFVPDLILSNPPYVKSDEIELLQKEVRREPKIALDGGKDGYDFYRILASEWIPKLQKGSSIAVECGEDQADEISQMFFLSRCQVNTVNDLSGFPRMVTAVRQI